MTPLAIVLLDLLVNSVKLTSMSVTPTPAIMTEHVSISLKDTSASVNRDILDCSVNWKQVNALMDLIPVPKELCAKTCLEEEQPSAFVDQDMKVLLAMLLSIHAYLPSLPNKNSV